MHYHIRLARGVSLDTNQIAHHGHGGKRLGGDVTMHKVCTKERLEEDASVRENLSFFSASLEGVNADKL